MASSVLVAFTSSSETEFVEFYCGSNVFFFYPSETAAVYASEAMTTMDSSLDIHINRLFYARQNPGAHPPSAIKAEERLWKRVRSGTRDSLEPTL